jgi:anti-anti-sigma factor
MTLMDTTRTTSLEVRARRISGTTVLSLEGELDVWTTDSHPWLAATSDLGTAGPVVIDLQRLYFLDQAGLGALKDLITGLERTGRRAALAGARPRIREFLRYAHAGDLAPMYGSVDEALTPGSGQGARRAPREN